MSSFLELIVAILVGIVGYLAISFLNIAIASELAIVIGAVAVGLILTIKNSISFDSSDESDSDVTTLYVGNLPYRANEGMVKELFSQYGNVQSVRLMRDRKTGKRKGFGFVEVAASEAKSVIKKLNDSDFQERTLKVRLAKDKPSPAN